MPPKRQAAESSSGAAKKSRKSEQQDPRLEEIANRQPFDYYCMPRPFFDVEVENDDKDEDDQFDEDELLTQYRAGAQNADHVFKPAADFPEQRWVAMWETWKQFCHTQDRASYTCPDLFQMYVYNDFNGYGLQEVVENLLNAFDAEFKKKKRSEDSLKQMWAVMAGGIHWLTNDNLGPWMMMDDGDRMMSTVALVGRAFISTLAEVERAGWLKADFPLKDLGLVMSLYIRWLAEQERMEDDEVDWTKQVVAYAKKAKIDLKISGCSGIANTLEEIEDSDDDDDSDADDTPARSTKTDPWGRAKALKDFKSAHGKGGKIGGEEYNICLMSRKERARYAFDGKDPLAKFSEKDLREGNLAMG